jgi:hypothetical protein
MVPLLRAAGGATVQVAAGVHHREEWSFSIDAVGEAVEDGEAPSASRERFEFEDEAATFFATLADGAAVVGGAVEISLRVGDEITGCVSAGAASEGVDGGFGVVAAGSGSELDDLSAAAFIAVGVGGADDDA